MKKTEEIKFCKNPTHVSCGHKPKKYGHPCQHCIDITHAAMWLINKIKPKSGNLKTGIINSDYVAMLLHEYASQFTGEGISAVQTEKQDFKRLDKATSEMIERRDKELKELKAENEKLKSQPALSKEKVEQILLAHSSGMVHKVFEGKRILHDLKLEEAFEVICQLFPSSNSEASRWISVNKPPEKDHTEVLLRLEGGEIISATYCNDVDMISWRSSLWEDWMKITHWMPIPEPPKN